MSGVYIKGLEMPKEGTWIGLILYADGGVREFLQPNKEYHAISVPDHGRLGDLDRLEKELAFDYAYAAADICKAAPTIIPAESEEEANEPPES